PGRVGAADPTARSPAGSPQGGRLDAPSSGDPACRPDTRSPDVALETNWNRSDTLPRPGYRGPIPAPARSKSSVHETPVPACQSSPPTHVSCAGSIPGTDVASGGSPARGPSHATRLHCLPARWYESTRLAAERPNQARRKWRERHAEPTARLHWRSSARLDTRTTSNRPAPPTRA